MADGRVWAIRGVSDRTRDAVLEAAHGAGLNIGEWLDRVLAKAAAEVLHPRPPAATREDVAALLEAQPGRAIAANVKGQPHGQSNGRTTIRGDEPAHPL